METVGIVGYGAMGSAFAERLSVAGVAPYVYDIDDATRHKASEEGFKVVDSAAELGEHCQFIDIMVRTDEEMIDATIGESGVCQRAKSGTILFLHSSVSPKTTTVIENSVSNAGIKVVDACATGVPAAVRAGTLIFLVGGDAEVVESARPHLERMAKHVVYMGPLGSGNVAKLVKNLVTASERLLVWQAVQIAEAAGLNYVDVLEMMELVFTEHPGLLGHCLSVFDASGASSVPWIGPNLFDKDIPLAAELGRDHGLDLPLTEQLVATATLLLELNQGRVRVPNVRH